MIFQNARIFTPEGFVRGGFTVENGRFGELFSGERAGALDLGGALVIPGLVDVHTHGAMGADFSDGDAEGLERMGRYLASRGVTSFAPTSMTLPYETITACGAGEDDMDKLSTLTMVPENARAGLLLRQLPDGTWKISLRTDGAVHAGEVLRTVGGGGHPDAAGAVRAGDPAALEREILAALKKAQDP